MIAGARGFYTEIYGHSFGCNRQVLNQKNEQRGIAPLFVYCLMRGDVTGVNFCYITKWKVYGKRNLYWAIYQKHHIIAGGRYTESTKMSKYVAGFRLRY